jgi:CHASE2 domain-containing sensor protein
MGRAGWRRRKTALLIAVAVLAAGAGVAAYATHLLARTELQSIDARFSIRGAEHPPANIVLVQIDNATLQQLQREHKRSQFPFPRKYDAARPKSAPAAAPACSEAGRCCANSARARPACA